MTHTRVRRGCGVTALAASLIAGAVGAPAHANPGSLVDLGTQSLAASAGATGIPTASLDPGTCSALEPRTLLPMSLSVEVDPVRDGNGHARITTSSTGLGVSGARFTLDWWNHDSGDSGRINSDTGHGRFASRDHFVHSGPGLVEWNVVWAEVWSDQPGLFGPVLPMSTCSGAGSIR